MFIIQRFFTTGNFSEKLCLKMGWGGSNVVITATAKNTEPRLSHLDDDVSLSCSRSIKFPVFFHHNNFSFLLHFLHVLFHLVENSAIILLGYADELE